MMMSFLKKLFENNDCDGRDEQTLDWVVSVLKRIEEANTELRFFSCSVQVAYGNNVVISLMENYDGMLSKYGVKYGLDKSFILGELDIYTSRLKPHIVGNRRQFLNRLERLLKENQIMGYKRIDKYDVLEKHFDN